MLTAKTVEKYGYVSLGIMILLLVLVWLKLVPDYLVLPLFFVAVFLFLGRIILRIVVARREKNRTPDDTPQ